MNISIDEANSIFMQDITSYLDLNLYSCSRIGTGVNITLDSMLLHNEGLASFSLILGPVLALDGVWNFLSSGIGIKKKIRQYIENPVGYLNTYHEDKSVDEIINMQEGWFLPEMQRETYIKHMTKKISEARTAYFVKGFLFPASFTFLLNSFAGPHFNLTDLGVAGMLFVGNDYVAKVKEEMKNEIVRQLNYFVSNPVVCYRDYTAGKLK